MGPVDTVILAAYLLVLVILSIYGSHRYFMAYLYYRHKYNQPVPKLRFEDLPRVTVQLPIFNELYVVERLVASVCALSYPRERLEIQVLDDSTDETQGLARSCVERWRGTGIDIRYIHRENRTGFKAGALENGLAQATGLFVAVFDADFMPESDFLERTIHFFTNPQVGMVQVRWGHLNRDFSALTQAQSIFLDGHFVIEHTARHRSGRFFNFNGTAGIWRRDTIQNAGGWQHDTLTEDLDLSYRAQLKGWDFVYLPDVVSPAEIPVEMNAFKSQQHRWAKGSIQTAMKLLPRIWKAELPWHVKQEAFFHLTANVAYVFMIPLALLMPLAMAVRVNHGFYEVLLLDLPFFIAATMSVCFFFIASQREVGPDWKSRLKYLPFLMALGIGMSVNNARAVIEAVLGHQSGFTRTPKLGVRGRAGLDRPWSRKRYRVVNIIQPLIEIGLGLYVSLGVVFALTNGIYASLPFLFLFQFGFLYVGSMSLLQGMRGRFSRPAPLEGQVELAS